jgi:hypothetical protein
MRGIFACIISKPLLLLLVQETISPSTQRSWPFIIQLATSPKQVCILNLMYTVQYHSHYMYVFVKLREITEHGSVVIKNTSEISCQVLVSRPVNDNQSHGHFLTPYVLPWRLTSLPRKHIIRLLYFAVLHCRPVPL